jgi:hypothetical protein
VRPGPRGGGGRAPAPPSWARCAQGLRASASTFAARDCASLSIGLAPLAPPRRAHPQRIEAWPIDGHEGYSIVALGLGAGKLWLYFFPSQVGGVG